MNLLFKMCELCNLKKKTKWYYEDEYFIVCDCETCKVPMIVLKTHSTSLLMEELIDLMWIMSKHLNGIFINKVLEGRLDQKRRKVLDHWHIHIR